MELLSGIAEGHPPPQPPTQAVFDPALLPLLHSSDFVWRFQHRDAATPGKEESRREVKPGTKMGRPGIKPAMLALLVTQRAGNEEEIISCHLQAMFLSTETSWNRGMSSHNSPQLLFKQQTLNLV